MDMNRCTCSERSSDGIAKKAIKKTRDLYQRVVWNHCITGHVKNGFPCSKLIFSKEPNNYCIFCAVETFMPKISNVNI
jgi:hypothetical protein